MLLRTCVLLDLRKIILSYLSIDPSVVFLRSHFFWLWLLHLVFHLSLCKLGKAVGSKWNTEWAGLCIWPGSTRVHQAKEWRWNWGASGPSKFWHPKTQEVRRRQVHLTNILTVLKNNGGFEWAGSCIWPPSHSKFAHNTKRQKVWKYQLQFKVYNRVNFGWSKIIILIEIFCRDAKSCRCCRYTYLCYFFFSWCYFLGHFGNFGSFLGNFGSFLGYFGSFLGHFLVLIFC